MEHEAWPTPQSPAREPLPRVEDLPVADQGYEQESVMAAFDSFYRHAAQLDAALRTLDAVDSFHRQAAALRADLRTLRAAGWTHDSLGWTAFEEAQEPSDAMTIIGAPQGVDEPGPEAPPTEPEPEPEEPELPPAAQAEPDAKVMERRGWRRRSAEPEAGEPKPEPPRHGRVLPAEVTREAADHWEQGLDAPD